MSFFSIYLLIKLFIDLINTLHYLITLRLQLFHYDCTVRGHFLKSLVTLLHFILHHSDILGELVDTTQRCPQLLLQQIVLHCRLALVGSHLLYRFLELCLGCFLVEFCSEAADFLAIGIKPIPCVDGQLIGYDLDFTTLRM